MHFGKRTHTAMAAMACLAGSYDGGRKKLSAEQIADKRGLQRPFVGKVLTHLARAGLIKGSPGPGGGYTLRRAPEEIMLLDIVRVFERAQLSECPLEGAWCPGDESCPVHDRLLGLQRAIEQVLSQTPLAALCRRRSMSPPANLPVVNETVSP